MIVSVQSALSYLKKEIPESDLKRKISAIESMIRDETNNNFQHRWMRFYAPSRPEGIVGSSPFLEIGDTIEINESINEGIYTVEKIEAEMIRLDRKLYGTSHNMVTKVVYPAAVQEGVLNMLQWELNMRSKTGIKSEILSRHSVTYFDMDAANSLDGYPVSLMGFLEPYYKAR
ncbi:MAG: hypothetical protein K2N80_05145 [Lachnospiraceae bacterium]|nr:hypothetical protein [Lachnospiraceae bacterium]